MPWSDAYRVHIIKVCLSSINCVQIFKPDRRECQLHWWRFKWLMEFLSQPFSGDSFWSVYAVLTDHCSVNFWVHITDLCPCVLRQKLIQVAKSFCKLQKVNKLWFRSLSLLVEDKRKTFWYEPSQKPSSFDCHKQGKVISKLNIAEQ